jgi:WD40 repeat protein
MALTAGREVIDLISDSEDESPSKAARSSLQAFIPRKEKAAPKHPNGTVEPLASTPQLKHRTPSSHAPAATPDTTNSLKDFRPNPPISLSEILSNGLQNAARSVGLIAPQQSAAVAPKRAGGLSPRNGAPTPRQNDAATSGSTEKRETYFVQYKPSANSVPPEKQPKSFVEYKPPPKVQGARRTSGPIHEERLRHFNEFHRKEAERKDESPIRPSVDSAADTRAGAAPLPVDRVAALAQRSASSFSQPSDNLSEPYWRRSSPEANGPEAKRRKVNYHEVDKINKGMIQARRLSAISIAQDLFSRQQTTAQALTSGVPASAAVPDTLQSTGGFVNTRDPAPAKAQTKSVDLTKEMNICADEGDSIVVAHLLSSKQKWKREVAPSVMAESSQSPADSSESDFPDEMPAKPMQRPSSKQLSSKQEPRRDTAKLAAPASETVSSESDSPDEIPARPMPSSRKDVYTRLARPAAAPTPTAPEAARMPRVSSALDNNSEPHQLSSGPTKVAKLIASVKNPQGSNHGIPYSTEEDDLLAHLREIVKIGWEEMPKYFSGRTRGSLQVRYSSKLKNRTSTKTKMQSSGFSNQSQPRQKAAPQPRLEYTAPSRRHPKAAQPKDGFVTWAELKAQRHEDSAPVKSVSPPIFEQASTQISGLGLDSAHLASLPRILRSREMGNTARRNWSSTARMAIPDELQNHVLDTLGPRRYFHGASRDVTCVAWAPDGNKFAAGAIAIDDERSMQYNRPNNLLLGDMDKNSLQELPEHHVARPTVSDSHNVNSLQAMQETQDPRLFKTVAAVDFSRDSKALYSAGGDGVVRMYNASSGKCLASAKQKAEVALLTSNSHGLLASGTHCSDDGSISVMRCHSDRLEAFCQLGPTRANVESSLPIFPSSLKWGAGKYSHLLLAGFASDSYDEDRLAAGEIFLWDSTADQKIDLPAARNVFDVAWNPFPSSGASLFAVAGARAGKINRSSIQCFAPDQGRAKCVIEWDCPAFDINDVVYCPHDDNLIAAGATDGKVYVWDKRTAGRDQSPLHILAHGPTKNVLDHDRDVEIADTGVRFLSWSATGNRLYSGSSDGVVKVWNPYCTTQDALVRDVATFNSAVMSGAFSSDYRDLLIGEDAGQLNLLGIDRKERSVRAAKKFDYCPAPALTLDKVEDRFGLARELVSTGQIEIRPMGALPVKQAVQGPNYQGPFLAPTDEQLRQLGAELQAASHEQSEARESIFTGKVDSEIKKAIRTADMRASRAREALERAQEKREDRATLAPAAAILQQVFRESRLEHDMDVLANATKVCTLDCNYLPAAGDEDGEAPDDRRYEQRIPGKLRLQRKLYDTADMTNAEITEAGLTSICSACRGPAAKSKRGLAVCERCTLSRSGFTARCEKCTAPVRPNLDDRVRHNICERCSFHCFRCGCIAAVSPSGDTVTCEPCRTQWEAGVLGYEVNRSPNSISHVKESHEQVMESLDERMGRLLGEGERERLAGGWKVALVDRSVGY